MSGKTKTKFVLGKAVFIRNRVPSNYYRNHQILPAGTFPSKKRKSDEELETENAKQRLADLKDECTVPFEIQNVEDCTAAQESKEDEIKIENHKLK